MKLTKQVIKRFEEEQEEFGTKTALYNVIWQIASDMMKDIGVTSIKTK